MRNVAITEVDSIIEVLKQRYNNGNDNSSSSNNNNKIRFICCDATRLSTVCRVMPDETTGTDDSDNSCDDEKAQEQQYKRAVQYDYIYDKGLMDALFCNEGWETGVSRLIHEASRVLVSPSTATSTTSDTSSSSNGGGGDADAGAGGMYILVSYPLPTSTRNFLMEQGDKVGLKWQFDTDVLSPIRDDNNLTNSTSTSSAARVSISMARKVATVLQEERLKNASLYE
jgi:hypothetical protein